MFLNDQSSKSFIPCAKEQPVQLSRYQRCLTTQSQPYLPCEETSHISGPEQGQSLILFFSRDPEFAKYPIQRDDSFPVSQVLQM